MTLTDRLRASFLRAASLVEPHLDMVRKAVSFALIGVVNVLIDTGVFLLAYSCLNTTPQMMRALAAFAEACQCASPASITLIAANIMSWLVAVSGSYVMNSHITFAAESGRQLRWRDYGTFLVSGVLGAIANTTTLVIAAKFIPVLPAKGIAILAGFVINFTMTHFVVFRHRRPVAGDVPM